MSARAATGSGRAVAPDAQRWPLATLAGLACSMRSFSGPALLAARGRLPVPVRYGVLAAAAGELIVDKAPFATNRTDASALGARIATGALTGRAVAGFPGLIAGGATAAAGTFLTFRARRVAVSTTGLPDRVIAVGEDLLAYSLVAVATRSR